MADKIHASLEGVPETMLMTLLVRAHESQRPDALINDGKAVAMVNQIDCNFSHLKLQGHDEIAIIMRMKKFDGFVRGFLERNPAPVVVHIGCGLDTRFERVDNGYVEWFDLDLPEVMRIRRQLLQDENPRCHILITSVFEEGWLQEVGQLKPRPFMFIAEGVFPYFEEAEVKSLFLKLREHFPGAELVCDAHTPFVIWTDNLQLALSRVSARLHWGLKHAKDVESWGEGIQLLDEWYYFDDPEPRMQVYRWMGRIPLLSKSAGVFHYRLGD